MIVVMTEQDRLLQEYSWTDLARIQDQLLDWFSNDGRDLPWRRTRDPYRILVSEVMLQQTQVDRVLPKYQAFVEQFPTLGALADASTADVIRAWAGLGYNRRAVNMQRAVRVVRDEFGGRFPKDVATLRSLPGIGPYTAGAIACFAFEQDVAFIDTNIRRVVQRLFVGPVVGEVSESQLQQVAEKVVPVNRGWSWNQAIMELGALICTSSNPACWRCPVQQFCRDYGARKQNDEGIFDVQSVNSDVQQVAERRQKYKRRVEQPFEGSSRFYRGRVIDALRQLPPDETMTLEHLGAQIKESFHSDDMPWLTKLVEGLVRDGLIMAEGDVVRLPH